jgi:hypothetical protein
MRKCSGKLMSGNELAEKIGCVAIVGRDTAPWALKYAKDIRLDVGKARSSNKDFRVIMYLAWPYARRCELGISVRKLQSLGSAFEMSPRSMPNITVMGKDKQASYKGVSI